MSAKTTSWEKAELIARKYEHAAMGGEDVKTTRTLPTIKEAVAAYLGDAEACGLADATMQKLRQIFQKQLLVFSEEHGLTFLRDLNSRNTTEWRHMFRDTFAIEMLLAGAPIDQVSILLGHASVRITEKHYSPWVRARQDQLEKSVQSAWQLLPGRGAKAS